jgi:hypothetical protein
MNRESIRVGAATVFVNLATFIFVVPFFLNNVHHHWIVPTFCSWILFQALLTLKFPRDWAKAINQILLAFALLIGILLFWRQFSMFQCLSHCEGRLAVGLVALTLSIGIAGRSFSSSGRRFCFGVASLYGIWALTVATLGWFQNTLNFN